jgi:glutathione S-transferase
MIVVYGVPVSVHTRKVIVAAILKKLKFRVEPVVPFQPPTNWAELSPTGLIPVIDNGGFTLADSTAICLYFDKLKSSPPLLPRGDKEAAHAMFLDAYAGDVLFRDLVHGLFFQRVIRPGMMGQPTDETVVRAILSEKAPRTLGYLDKEVAAGRLSANRMSLPDIAVASNLVNYCYLGFTLDGRRHLAAFLASAVKHPAFAQALAAEKPFADQMGLKLAA